MQFPFYVYELVDPRDGAVFYVGKGRGNRIMAHEQEAKRGEASDKCDRIREVWAAGLKVERREVARFQDAKSALDHEADRIGWYCGLTNVVRNNVRGGRSRNVWLSRHAMRVLAWWIKQTNGGRNLTPPHYPGQPWRTALAKAFIPRGQEFAKRVMAEAPFEEVAKRLRPFGVHLVQAV